MEIPARMDFLKLIAEQNWTGIHQWHRVYTPWLTEESIISVVREYQRDVEELV